MIHHLTPDFLLDRLARGERSGRLDGACVFVDISGFTPLTLALMEHGTEGAEVLAGVLAAVFTPLIDTVYAHGGFIAGFAGDAFKAVFPAANDDAAVAASAVAHAVTAAWAMGEHLRHAAAQTTRFGTFAFSGKVCVAAGAVHWEVWQADGPLAADAQQAAYVFGGPALDAAMQLDPLAARGEVVLTAAVAAHMAQPLQTAAREGGLLLTRLDAPLPASEDAGHTPAGDPALAAHFFPSALLNSTVQGEFRRVTTAFVNLTGTLPAAARDDFAATLFRLLAQYDGFLGRVGRIGGKDDGHTFLLFWGAPTGSERDVDRALGFLLDMQAASPVALRAGVTTHLAYAGFVGAPRREEYTCYGSYVNLAARQVIAAAAHEIWVDAATATAARDFTTVAHGTHTFKGMDAARPIFLVTGRRARTQARAYDGHMVGRTRELAQLEEAMAPIFRRSFGGMVIVRGEAGMGKSRLAHEFLQATAFPGPVHRHVLQTDEILRRPLNPFRYWLRSLFEQTEQADETTRKRRFDAVLDALIAAADDEHLAVELARTRSFLGALVDLFWADSLYSRLEPQLRRDNTRHALKTLILALCRRQPLILLLEDTHWLDDESWDFLPLLQENMGDVPLALIATTRPLAEDAAPGGQRDILDVVSSETPRHLIDLTSLSADGVAELAAALLRGPVTPDLARDVTAQSDGNPFFAEQLVLYLHEQGLLSATAAGWQRDPAAEQDTAGQILSGDVRTVLTARLDRLDPELRRSVQMASVLGREFDTRLLAAMVEETMPAARTAAQTPIAHVLAAGRKARLWSAVDESAADVRYLFRHELLRSTAYDMQLRARLRGLHARAAAAIATVFGDELAPRYADLAYHHRRAEQPAEERHFAALAGRYAADQFANRDAMRHLERALALLDPDDAVNKFELLLLHEQVADTSGDRTRQRADVDALLQVAAQLAQPARLGQALLRAGHHARVTNDHAGAVGQLTAALDLAQADDDPRLTVACFNGLGKVEWRRHRYDAAEQHLIAALARAEVDAHLAADSVYHLGLVDYSRGKLDAANARFDAALTRFIALGDRKGEAMALSMIGAVEYRLGRYDHAVTIAEQGLEAADAIGWTYLRAHALASLGNSLFDLGQFDACRARHRQAVDLYRSLHDQEGEARSLDTIGLAATLLGDLAEAATHFEDAATRQREIDDGPGLAYTLSHHALALVAAGDLDGAQAALEEALALRTRLDDAAGALECRVGLADVARRRGRTDVAYAAAVALWPEFRATPVANVEAPIRVCLSLARIFQTRDDPAARAWTQAVIDYGHALLDARAAALADPAMRAGFLTAVPEHRALLDMQR